MKISFWERTSINLVSNALRTAVMAVIGIFLIPYYIDNLGTSSYAIIPLATTISYYVVIVSDCLLDGCGRYISLAIGRDDQEEVSRSFNTTFFGLLKVCLVLLPVCLVIAYLSPSIFSVPPSAEYDVQVLFAFVLISSLIVSFSSVFTCLFFAHNMMYIVHLSRLAHLLFQVGMIFILFTVSTPSLIDIGVSYLLASFLFVILQVINLRKIPNRPKIRANHRDPKLLMKMGTLSTWAIIQKVGSLMYIEVSLILVNIYLGSQIQAGFAILATLISMLGTVLWSITASVDPLYFKLYAEERRDDLKRVMHVSAELMGYFIAMPIAFIMAFAPNILEAWVGTEFVYLSDVLVVAAAAFFIAGGVKCINAIPILYKRNMYTTVSTVVFGVLNFVLCFAFLRFTDYGLEAAVYVWAGCFFLEELAFLLICVFITKSRKRDQLLPPLQGYAALFVCYLLFMGLRSIVDIGTGLFTIIVVFSIFFLAYLVIILKFLMPREDLELVSVMVPKALRKFVLK